VNLRLFCHVACAYLGCSLVVIYLNIVFPVVELLHVRLIMRQHDRVLVHKFCLGVKLDERIPFPVMLVEIPSLSNLEYSGALSQQDVIDAKVSMNIAFSVQIVQCIDDLVEPLKDMFMALDSVLGLLFEDDVL